MSGETSSPAFQDYGSALATFFSSPFDWHLFEDLGFIVCIYAAALM